MGDIVDVRTNEEEATLQYKIEWHEEGQIYTTWEDKADTTETQRREYWFGVRKDPGSH
jgi:hypothetical protein